MTISKACNLITGSKFIAGKTSVENRAYCYHCSFYCFYLFDIDLFICFYVIIIITIILL